MQKRTNPDLEVQKPLLDKVDGFDRSKKAVKVRFIYPGRTARRVGREAEQFNLPRPNLVAEDTYVGGGEDEVHGRREDGVEEVTTAKRFVSCVDTS